MSCYWGGELCDRGHIHDCPGAKPNPWDEATQPNATPMPPADEGAVASNGWYFSTAEKRWILEDA